MTRTSVCANAFVRTSLVIASTFQNTTVYTMVAVFYLAMSLPMMRITKILERRFGKHEMT